jgi:signal transduction histidine kinase
MIGLVIADAGMAVIAFVIGALILWRKPRHPTYQLFFLFTAGIALSAVAKSFFWWPGDYFARAAAEGGFEIMVLAAYLAVSLGGRPKVSRNIIFLIVPWFFSFLALPAIIVVASTRADPVAFFWHLYHGVLPLTAALMAGYVLGGLARFFFRRADSFPSPAFLARGLTFVMIVAAGVMCTADLVLPVFGIARFAAISNFFALLVIVLGGYGIVRYGFGGIPALRAGIFYLLSLLSVAAIFFGLEFVLEKSFFQNDEAVDIVAAVAGALAFLPLRRWFDGVTDKIFFRGRDPFSVAAAEFGRALGAASDRDAVLAATSNFLASVLRPTALWFFTFDPMSPRTAVLVPAVSYGVFPAEGSRELAAWCRREKIEGSFLRDVFSWRSDGDIHELSAVSVALADRAEPLGVAAIVSVLSDDCGDREVVALLGGKMSGVLFSRDDRWYAHYAAERTGEALDRIVLRNAARAERESFEEQVLAKASRLREMCARNEEFLTDVSHELKTPLAVLKTYTAALAGDGRTSRDKALRVIDGTVDRMGRLIEELLNAVRRTGPFGNIPKSEIMIDDLLRDVCDDCVLLAKDRRIALYRSCREKLIVLGERDRLKEVILNLVSNALQHTGSGGSITLSARPADGEAEIAVSDTGSGIPSADLSHLFERFYRIPSEGSSGTGIGLYLCRRIVESYGGTIVAESAVGSGSRFVIRLPLVVVPAPRAQTRSVLQSVRGG